MSDNRKSILAKIRAILSKTVENGCTEGEAMVALAKARAMMDAHDVTDTDLAFDGEEVTREECERNDPDQVRWTLCSGVAKFCDCRVWGEGKKIIFFGLESDSQFASWLLDTLEGFVRRQSLSFLADMGRAVGGETDLFGAPLNGAQREHKRRSFVFGCMHRINERLRQEAQDRILKSQRSDGRSLVVVKTAKVDSAFKALSLHFRKARGSRGINADPAAFQRGRQAGNGASFGKPVGGNGNGSTLRLR